MMCLAAQLLRTVRYMNARHEGIVIQETTLVSVYTLYLDMQWSRF